MILLVGCKYKIYNMIKFCIYIYPVNSKIYNMTLSSLHSSSRIQFSGDWVYKQFYFIIQMMYDKHSDLNKIAFLNVQVRGFLFRINTGIFHIKAWYFLIIILEVCLGYKTWCIIITDLKIFVLWNVRGFLFLKYELEFIT